MKNVFIHDTSIVDDNVEIGEGTKVWCFCHIQSGARIGERCSFGQNVNVANNVRIGKGVKVQNNLRRSRAGRLCFLWTVHGVYE